MIVYSNSCSFGQPNQGHDTYPELIAGHYNATLINRGIPGSCNRRIIRTSTRDLLELKKQSGDDNILCLLGLTFISRTELWQPNIPSKDNDGNFHSITVDHKKYNWTSGLINTYVKDIHLSAPANVQNYYQQWLLHMSKEAIITELITDIILFKNFCQQQNIDVLIWSNAQLWPNNPEIAIDDIFLKSLVYTINDYRQIINPWNFCFLDYALKLGHRPRDENIYGLTGHPGQAAHKDFALFLIDYLRGIR
jgi:hypothetical protein